MVVRSISMNNPCDAISSYACCNPTYTGGKVNRPLSSQALGGAYTVEGTRKGDGLGKGGQHPRSSPRV